MLLKQLSFVQHQDTPNEWRISGRTASESEYTYITFQHINLMVGVNASGKSRIINALRRLADLVSGEAKVSSLPLQSMGKVRYEVIFDQEGKEVSYILAFTHGKILDEILVVDGQVRLNRIESKLWYEGLNQFLDFEPDDDVLSVALRDKKQQSFFEGLYHWGKQLVHYRFGTPLGRNVMLRERNSEIDEQLPSLKDDKEVAGIFLHAQHQFKDGFVEDVKQDMRALDYQISKIDIDKPHYVPLPGFVLYIMEDGVESPVDQMDISQGMFRALSLIIQLNYALLASKPSCILIDDIGEGLDFARSTQLIKLIRDKVAGSQVQVVMTTNDRFVMNDVPLAHWMVLERKAGQSVIHSQANSP